jgi:branched-chain amino acid aminotransferase
VKVWLDGAVLDAADARISVRDHGLTVGDGVFETMKVTAGVPFAITRHLTRLRDSAARLGLRAPDADDLRKAAEELIAAHQPAEVGRLRITVTGGDGPPGTERGTSGPTVLLVVGAGSTWPASAALATVPWARNERSAVAGAKTTSYAENVVALAYAKDRGAAEALFCDTRGNLCEGTGSNLFVVADGALLTPALSTGCLAGVTRGLVLEWSGAEEAELPVKVLDRASEVFITSSTRDVQPVHAVDGRTYAVHGRVTAEAVATFAARSGADPDP